MEQTIWNEAVNPGRAKDRMAATAWLISRPSLTANVIPYAYDVAHLLQCAGLDAPETTGGRVRSQVATASQTLGGVLLLNHAQLPANTASIASAAVLPVRTVQKHLKVLEKVGLLHRQSCSTTRKFSSWELKPGMQDASLRVANLPRWFAMATRKWTDRMVFADMASRIDLLDSHQQLETSKEEALQNLAEQASVTKAEIVKRTYLSRPSVASALLRLTKMGAACRSMKNQNRFVLNPHIAVTRFVAKAHQIACSIGLKIYEPATAEFTSTSDVSTGGETACLAPPDHSCAIA